MRVTNGGVKSFSVHRRVKGGRQIRRTLGTWPELSLTAAKALAPEAIAEIRQGVHRAEERREQVAWLELTTGQAIEAYIKAHQSKRQIKNEGGCLRDLLTSHAHRSVAEITAVDINRALAEKRRVAPISANRCLSYCRSCWKWLEEQGHVESGVAAGIAMKKVAEVAWDHLIQPDDLRRIWHAAGGMSAPWCGFFRFALATGQRRAEVAQATWDQIDLKDRVWNLPAKSTKMKTAHVVHLNGLALGVLRGLNHQEGLLFTFSGRPLCGFSKSKLQLDKLSGVTGWRLHDFRRVIVTAMRSSTSMLMRWSSEPMNSSTP